MILLLLVAFMGCNDNSTDSTAQKKVKIAAILDLSGAYKVYGLECKQALELIQKKNQDFEISYYDCKSINESADSILNLIIAEDNKPAIVTLSSWVSNYLAEKIAQNNLLQIPVGSSAFTKSDLRSSIMMTVRVEKESDFLISKLSAYNKIALMHVNNALGDLWNSQLANSLGERIVASEIYDDTKSDFTEELTRIASQNPDIVVLVSTSETGAILSQAEALGLNLAFIGTRTVLTNELLKANITKDFIFSYPKINYDFQLIKDFEAEYGYRPSSFTAEIIDLCLLLQKAAAKSKCSRDELIEFVKNSSLNGSFHTIKFDGICRAEYDFTIMKLKDGKFAELE